jgi:hypothetical protein
VGEEQTQVDQRSRDPQREALRRARIAAKRRDGYESLKLLFESQTVDAAFRG